MSIRAREEIPAEARWDVASIYSTDQAWEEDVPVFLEQLKQVDKHKEEIVTSAKCLYEKLEEVHQLKAKAEMMYTYAHLRHDEDTANATYQAMYEKAIHVWTQLNEKIAFLEPALLTLSEETLQRFYKDEPKLMLYKRFFAMLAQKKGHVLTEEQEAFLAKASEVTSTSWKTYSAFNDADVRFPNIEDKSGKKVEVTSARMMQLLMDDDRAIRKQAYESVYQTYKQYRNTLASTLSGEVKAKSFVARMRNYQSARQAALTETFVPEQVYDQLIAAVHDHRHLLHRYMRLRKKLLKLDELCMYDLHTPLVKNIDMDVSYEQSQQILCEALAPLGQEYVDVIQKGFQERWVDVYENEGKRSGAYSSGSYGTKPFILMSWQGNYDDLSTLAHEFGHSVHSYYTWQEQPPVYGHYTIFLAEVASILNEALLHDYLMKKETDGTRKLYLLNQYLEGIRTTVFRQTMFAEFEHHLYTEHESGRALTAESISQVYAALNKAYHGDEVCCDEYISYEWARIPHFYLNYYVYQYATGYSAASALAKQVLIEGEPAAKRMQAFFKAGMSKDPIKLLKETGVDMQTAQPIVDTMSLFEKTLDEMEQLLKEQLQA